MKGLVMRVLAERLKDRELELTDGIKVVDERGWAHVLPDPDEPIVHVYAEGETERESVELETELRSLIEDVLQEEGEPAASRGSS
jgi:mannose-1-phosphate guanylyltransferase/phosphomannomutase